MSVILRVWWRAAAFAALLVACGGGERAPLAEKPATPPLSEQPAAPTTTGSAASSTTLSESSIPPGWVWAEVMGWRCALPAPARKRPAETGPDFLLLEAAIAEVAPQTRVAIITQTWNPILQDRDPVGFARGYFKSGLGEMPMIVHSERTSTFRRDGLECEALDIDGTIESNPVSLKMLACRGRGTMFMWAGSQSRLAEVIASCRLTPIAEP